jgi:hypothetical protein
MYDEHGLNSAVDFSSAAIRGVVHYGTFGMVFFGGMATGHNWPV